MSLEEVPPCEPPTDLCAEEAHERTETEEHHRDRPDDEEECGSTEPKGPGKHGGSLKHTDEKPQPRDGSDNSCTETSSCTVSVSYPCFREKPRDESTNKHHIEGQFISHSGQPVETDCEGD